jgi:hypothetical protein
MLAGALNVQHAPASGRASDLGKLKVEVEGIVIVFIFIKICHRK